MAGAIPKLYLFRAAIASHAGVPGWRYRPPDCREDGIGEPRRTTAFTHFLTAEARIPS